MRDSANVEAKRLDVTWITLWESEFGIGRTILPMVLDRSHEKTPAGRGRRGFLLYRCLAVSYDVQGCTSAAKAMDGRERPRTWGEFTRKQSLGLPIKKGPSSRGH